MESERLLFRVWNDADLPLARSLWGDPEVMKFLSARPQLTDDEIMARLQAEIGFQRKHGIQYWPMFEKETGTFVGCCGLKSWLHSSRAGLEHGFHLVRSMWGKGYAAEASRRVIDFGFQELKLSEISAAHHPQNRHSQRILLKQGFEYVEDVLFKPTGLLHPSYVIKR